MNSWLQSKKKKPQTPVGLGYLKEIQLFRHSQVHVSKISWKDLGEEETHSVSSAAVDHLCLCLIFPCCVVCGTELAVPTGEQRVTTLEEMENSRQHCWIVMQSCLFFRIGNSCELKIWHMVALFFMGWRVFWLVPEELPYMVFACDWLDLCFLMTVINLKFIKWERGIKISETLFMFVFHENKW